MDRSGRASRARGAALRAGARLGPGARLAANAGAGDGFGRRRLRVAVAAGAAGEAMLRVEAAGRWAREPLAVLSLPVVVAGEPLDDDRRERVKAMCSATDNVGLFFGEDIFLAIGSILLIVGFLDQSGVTVEPLHLSMWAIPSAIAAFVIHGARLMLFDRKLKP